MAAARSGCVDVLRLLLGRRGGKSDMDDADESGWTALHLASLHGHVDVCRLLLRAGASRHGRDYLNRTPVELAKAYGQMEVAALLKVSGSGRPVLWD
jgi:ankyrin repeat protein